MTVRRLLMGLLVVFLVVTAVLPRPRLPAALASGSSLLLGSSITYQGLFMDAGSPANGVYDFEFRLFDALTGGSQVGVMVTVADLTVSEGLFTAVLDFGSVFDDTALWLEIAARDGGSSGAYTTLSPRQPLTATPYALFATTTPWNGLLNVPAGFADGTDNDTTYTAGTGLNLSGGSFSLVPAYRLPQACSHGSIAEWNGSSWVCGLDDVGAPAWYLSGNSGTSPSTHFMGTTDNQPLQLRVNGTRALLLQPNATSPNLLGGYSGNSTSPGVLGATIGGGGQSGAVNQVQDAFGTVAGGRGNTAGGLLAAVGGGEWNEARGDYATVAGGAFNSAMGLDTAVAGGINNSAAGDWSMVGGGSANSASADYAAIGGGQNNVVTDTHGTVGGGSDNSALGIYTTVSGGQFNTATNWNATVGGGYFNTANGLMATVGGGSSNDAWGNYATVAGGVANDAHSFASFVGGGNDNDALASGSVIGGGQYNKAINYYAFIGGGVNNTANGIYSAIGGGDNNFVSGQSATIAGGSTLTVTADFGTIGGGQNNEVHGLYGTISGGRFNTSGSDDATIGGGVFNNVTQDGATIGGGNANTANEYYATVGGGSGNYADGYATTISGGEQNTAFGDLGTVGGGNLNHVPANYGTVAGGNGNTTNSYAGTIGGGTANYVTGDYATIAGGRWNRVEAPLGTIGGGGYHNPADRNYVTDEGGTIAGGGSNYAGNGPTSTTDAYYATVSGGWDNTASSKYSTIGGGHGNVIGGEVATIPGGWLNTAAGDYSFAAGCQAQANHNGAFVWADSRNCTPFASQRDYQFRVRAWGGARFDDEVGNWVDFIWSQPIDTSTGAYLSWGGTWTNASDVNLKENFVAIDSRAVLEAVADLPIQSWNYRSEDDDVRHVGPTAQDFAAAFGLGDGETAISTVDADGVALTAVQALYQINQEQAVQIEELEERLAALEGERPLLNSLAGVDEWPVLLGLLFIGCSLWQRRRGQAA